MGVFHHTTRILPLTGGAGCPLWLGQYLLGEYSDKVRWLSFLHIPIAFLVFGLAAMLSGRAHRLMAGRYADVEG